MINELMKKYCIYYIGVKDNEEITLFDNVEIINKMAIVSAEDMNIAIKIFQRKSGISKKNIIAIKQGQTWVYRG